MIADPDDAARVSLAELLRDAGYAVREATSGEEALTLIREEMPALAILEVPLGSTCGYEVCRSLREDLGDDLPILFLSGTRREAYDRVAGLLVGADDYLGKPYATDELLARVRRLVRQSRSGIARSQFRLTPRELEVLELLADGLAPDEIAARLVISAKTVGTHVEHIFTKLGVRSKAQAVAIAYREGLVTQPK